VSQQLFTVDSKKAQQQNNNNNDDNDNDSNSTMASAQWSGTAGVKGSTEWTRMALLTFCLVGLQ